MDLVRLKIIVSNFLIMGTRTNALLLNILVFLMVYLYNVFRIHRFKTYELTTKDLVTFMYKMQYPSVLNV